MSYVEVVPVQNVLREGEGEAWAALALVGHERRPLTPCATCIPAYAVFISLAGQLTPLPKLLHAA